MKPQSVSISMVSELLRCARHLGYDTDELLDRSRIPKLLFTIPHARIPVSKYCHLHRRVMYLCGDESLGMLSKPVPRGVLKMALELAIHSETVRKALENFVTLLALTTDSVALKTQAVEQNTRLHILFTDTPPWQRELITGWYLGTLLRGLSWLARRNIPMVEAGFEFGPEHKNDEHKYIYPCHCVFEISGPSYIEFPSTTLSYPVVRNIAEAELFVRAFPLDIMARYGDGHTTGGRVLALLSAARHDNLPNRSQIARKLSMSEETLRRKLSAEGLSFQQIKDELRRDIAIQHLSRDRLKISEISDKLGFSSPGAFTRAFKQWTSMTPESYRKTQ